MSTRYGSVIVPRQTDEEQQLYGLYTIYEATFDNWLDEIGDRVDGVTNLTANWLCRQINWDFKTRVVAPFIDCFKFCLSHDSLTADDNSIMYTRTGWDYANILLKSQLSQVAIYEFLRFLGDTFSYIPSVAEVAEDDHIYRYFMANYLKAMKMAILPAFMYACEKNILSIH